MSHDCKPHPAALDAVLGADTDITLFRNVHCSHYTGCIDVVVKKGWASFTCAACPLFKATPAPHAAEHAFDQPADPGRP